MSVEPITVTETVQARGATVTRERTTVQDTSKLAQVYVLPGETVMQKLASLRALASLRELPQIELLAYIEDIRSAPLLLDTVEVDDVD